MAEYPGWPALAQVARNKNEVAPVLGRAGLEVPGGVRIAGLPCGCQRVSDGLEATPTTLVVHSRNAEGFL